MKQQTLDKEIKIQPKLNYFNSVVKREYEIDTQNINYNKLNEEYNRHKILNYYHEYLLSPLLRPEFDFDNLDQNDKLKKHYYYYEYLNKLNISSDTIIKCNQSYLSQVPAGVIRLPY